MNVYVVNLDNDVEKMRSIDKQLRRTGVNYQRVSAIYGKDLSAESRAKVFNGFRWWCAMGRKASPAEIGCALSHYEIYRTIKKPVCILEDDVKIDDCFTSVLDLVERSIDCSKAQVVLLSDHVGAFAEVKVPTPMLIRSKSGMCTDGYVLTPKAAEVLLKNNLPIIVPCDTWGRWASRGLIELYHALPTSVTQLQGVFGTSTACNRKAVADMPLLEWTLHKAKRCVGKLIDCSLSKIFRG